MATMSSPYEDDLFKNIKLKHHRIIQCKNTEDINNQKKLSNLCGVCNNKASGKHYGLSKCEGCKGLNYFFILNLKNMFFL